jgi:RNA polymerase sigma-70 factor (ECF subfamily)
MDIGDGDLVRLARDGDPAAFRLLAERHLPMARARAARLCPQPDDADDAVQDAFLQAFIGQVELRNPALIRHAEGDASQVWQAEAGEGGLRR